MSNITRYCIATLYLGGSLHCERLNLENTTCCNTSVCQHIH